MLERNYDVVVAGAGPAGICAAVEAARSGAKTALIERYGCIGGNLTQGYVGPLLGGTCAGTMSEEIARRVCPVPGAVPDFEWAKIALTEMVADAGVDVYLQEAVVSVEREEDRLCAVIADGKCGPIRFAADVYIDATGDGDVAYLAGCPYDMGRTGDGLIQPVSFMFIIQGVDEDQHLLCEHEEHHTDLGDGREYLDLCHRACKTGELPKNVNIVRLYKTAYPDERMVNASQENYINPFDPTDLFRAEASLRRQTNQIVDFLKNNIPGFADIRVKGSSTTLGVRESRRILGDYVITVEDVAAGRLFDDAVVHHAGFCVDIHNPDGPGQSEFVDKRPTIAGAHDIPFRAMTPQGINNLITAGRCISGTHEAMASFRVMNICFAMGQAAGAAAALMKTHGISSTRALDVALIREHLKSRGVKLDA
ncbi:MAG: FAD-dependent oxidoreductase [Clostridia bacterium]|nr:FAD-dependent oxidoreductase [Clostridia bacterium]